MTIVQRAQQWMEHDPDPETKRQLSDLIDAGDKNALQALFAGPLAFGTAGVRAELGPGESRMNVAVVTRITYGLMQWLKNTVGDAPVVVVGCDARHGSEKFQQAAAEVISALGGTALVLPAHNPTPLTAFSVKAYSADAGVMITASHNPPADNGYKVYLGGRVARGEANGVQLIPPADTEIATAYSAAPWADEIPRDRRGIREVDPREDYAKRAAALAGLKRDLVIALTPMHGVGGELGARILRGLGFEVSVVPEQAEPDPDFPTVAFPNPEEEGALDLAMDHATTIGADVIIAYDPDADRMSVAVPCDGTWRQLSGDEVGALLGEYLARRGATGALATSIVSSRLLERIADDYGLRHATTLTGFKWIARTPDLAFGYEEAIGYCCDPHAVADKDGISASVVLASLAAELKAQGRSLEQALDYIARRHGLYLSAPLTFRVDDARLIAEKMELLRTHGPSTLANARVVESIDLAEGTLPCGATDGMCFITENNDRVIVRPSGTEPKLKCYLEVVLDVDGDDVPRNAARQRLGEIATDLRRILQM